MENISECDVQQLKIMHENLISFEKKQIGLSLLVSSLAFLVNALESLSKEWEELFFKEMNILETINASAITKDLGKEVSESEKNKRELLVTQSILNLKNLIMGELYSLTALSK